MKRLLFCLPLVAASASAPAPAQSTFIPSVIGQTVMNSTLNSGYPSSCYDPSTPTHPKSFATADLRSKLAMADYIKFSEMGHPDWAFFGLGMNRTVDGVAMKNAANADPWIGKVVGIERITLAVGNANNQYRAQWKAYGEGGALLGIYDAYLRRAKDRARILQLKQYSVGSSAQPEPMKPFCDELGDIEKWQEAKAKYEAEKAAKRAAKEAARNSRRAQQ